MYEYTISRLLLPKKIQLMFDFPIRTNTIYMYTNHCNLLEGGKK